MYVSYVNFKNIYEKYLVINKILFSVDIYMIRFIRVCIKRLRFYNVFYIGFKFIEIILLF